MTDTAASATPAGAPEPLATGATPAPVPPDGGHVPALIRAMFVVNLVAEIGIIGTGGLVRLTGSGLGCPTWPQCVPGSYIPTVEQEEGYHKLIEFGNRLLTFVVLAAAVAVLWAVYQRLSHRRSLRLPAWLLIGGIVAQAVIGGVSVRTGLSPVTVSVHFIVSAALVAVSAYLLFRLDEGEASRRVLVPSLVERLGWATVAVGAVVLVLGTVVTGSGPHSGDAETPARYGFDPRAVSWLHADAVILFVGLALAMWLACRLVGEVDRAARAWRDVLVLSLLQGGVGYAQYALALPEGLVLLHMLLAALFVVALTRGVMALRTRA